MRFAAGSILLPLDAEASDAEAYDDTLREALAGLPSEALASRLAGLVPRATSVSPIAPITRDGSCSCFAAERSTRAARYYRQRGELPDGTYGTEGTGASTRSGDAGSERFSEGVERLFGGTHPEEIRTLPLPREVRETAVRVTIVDRLVNPAWPDQLPALPEGVEHSRDRPESSARSGSSASWNPDGQVFRTSRLREGVNPGPRPGPPG